MKKIALFVFCLFTIASEAQVSIGLLAEPSLNLTKVGSEPKILSDSIIDSKSYDYTVSFGIEIRKNIDRYQSFSIIPGYHQTNILTQMENLQFLDVVHPQLPEIRDLAFAATKRAEVRYRHMYLGSQFLYNRRLQVRGLSPKMAINVGGGLGAFFLFSQDAKVNTEGFAIDGKYTHIITDSIGIESRPLLIETILTADYTLEVLPKTEILAGIKLAIPMTPTTSSQPKMTVWAPALRVAIRRVL